MTPRFRNDQVPLEEDDHAALGDLHLHLVLCVEGVDECVHSRGLKEEASCHYQSGWAEEEIDLGG